jgi:tRNA dimethylallyltransferase
MSDSTVLVIAGATAAGKTQLALDLALRFDAEIVGADSRQIYTDMPIGTAAPARESLSAVRHHCVAMVEPYERYSAGRFERDALSAIADIHAHGKRAIVTGGTGFYIRALTGGVGLARAYDEQLRVRLQREASVHEPNFLHEWLVRLDSRRAAAIDPKDTYRVLRALEIRLANSPISNGAEEPRRPEFVKLALDVPIAEIDRRIANRTGHMLANGLIEEAERIGPNAVAGSAVGYPQALAYLRGWSTVEELRATLLRATKRYARRQIAWFRREPGVEWVSPGDVADVVREKLGWREKPD